MQPIKQKKAYPTALPLRRRRKPKKTFPWYILSGLVTITICTGMIFSVSKQLHPAKTPTQPLPTGQNHIIKEQAEDINSSTIRHRDPNLPIVETSTQSNDQQQVEETQPYRETTDPDSFHQEEDLPPSTDPAPSPADEEAASIESAPSTPEPNEEPNTSSGFFHWVHDNLFQQRDP